MNMLLLMTPTEVADYGELHATTDLERALLGAIEHFEQDLDSKVEDAEHERDSATEERDEARTERDNAHKNMAEARDKLIALVGDSDEALALYGEVLDLLEADE